MITDLLIVGAGPAGMAAATKAHALGVAVTVVDVQAAQGGQFLRQPPADFKVRSWLAGKTYLKAKNLLDKSKKLADINWLMRSAVTGIFPIHNAAPGEPRFRITLDTPDGYQEYRAQSVLIAGGCYDLPAIFPGWTTPGVMAAGGIQAFIKSQQLVPGQRFVLAGSHPLQLIIADQIIQSGGEVAAVLFSQSLSTALSVALHPSTLFRQANKYGQTLNVLRRLRKAGVPIHFNRAVTRATGTDILESVCVAPVNAKGEVQQDDSREIECDRLGVCFGFLSSSELARQVNAECDWNSRRGGWIAKHDQWMNSSIPGIYVAGETTGVAGSDVAMDEGSLAAIGCSLELGKLPIAEAKKLAKPVRRRLRSLHLFADMLSQLSWPGDGFFDQLMTNDSIICKCEELNVGGLLKTLHDNPEVTTASSIKLLSRAGMGLCQGRYCHHAITRVLAQSRGLAEQDIAGFTARFPSIPTPVSQLIGEHEPKNR